MESNAFRLFEAIRCHQARALCDSGAYYSQCPLLRLGRVPCIPRSVGRSVRDSKLPERTGNTVVDCRVFAVTRRNNGYHFLHLYPALDIISSPMPKRKRCKQRHPQHMVQRRPRRTVHAMGRPGGSHLRRCIVRRPRLRRLLPRDHPLHLRGRPHVGGAGGQVHGARGGPVEHGACVGGAGRVRRVQDHRPRLPRVPLPPLRRRLCRAHQGAPVP
mmetsp:Transcript_71774/g.191504  ORF Transcript_71774/g.191504 Transcript_71774/m.191504 type:complete len:215 (+) Transcript_71774:227-871(+)